MCPTVPFWVPQEEENKGNYWYLDREWYKMPLEVYLLLLYKEKYVFLLMGKDGQHNKS